MADEVEREITVPVPPDEAWSLVTDAEELQRWLAPEVEIDLRDGGEVRIVGDDGGERRGTVELVEAPRRLRFAWTAPDGDPSIVEISVDPDEEGSRIRVSDARWSSRWPRSASFWSSRCRARAARSRWRREHHRHRRDVRRAG